MVDYKNLVSDNGPTVAQRILTAVQAKLAALVDQDDIVFPKVVFGDLESFDNRSPTSCGIDRGEEQADQSIGMCTTYFMPLFVHVRFRPVKGVDELQVWQYYLGLLQMAVLGDNNLGGLTLDIVEESNSHSIIGIEGVYPGGTLSVMVKYRTRLHNPYKLITDKP
jgi:hypothetical protein